MNPEIITSSKNPLIKEIKRGVARGGLTESGLMIAETRHLLDEAVRSGLRPEVILVSENSRPALPAVRTMVLPDALFREVSATDTPQGVIALVRPPVWALENVFPPDALVAVIDGIQEPGNAGAVVRAAEAFGASGVVLLKGSVNPFNPKAVRASAGSIFRVPVVAGVEPEELLAAVDARGCALYAALPGTGEAAYRTDLRRACAITIGSEGRGVSTAMTERSIAVRIPTAGVESLNAAVAAGVLLYEARRQRMIPS